RAPRHDQDALGVEPRGMVASAASLGRGWVSLAAAGPRAPRAPGRAPAERAGRRRGGGDVTSRGNAAMACVMGDMDLLWPLARAGIRCAVVAPPGTPPRFSRFTRAALDWVDAWERPGELVAILERFGAAQPVPPVLFYEEDRELLLVSRYRDRLRRVFRFVVPDRVL